MSGSFATLGTNKISSEGENNFTSCAYLKAKSTKITTVFLSLASWLPLDYRDGVWGWVGGAVSGFCDVVINFPKSRAEAIKTLRTF